MGWPGIPQASRRSPQIPPSIILMTPDRVKLTSGRVLQMAELQLSLIMGSNDRSRPVLDGSVKPDGIDLTSTVAHPSEIFWRQLHFQEFDVSEMSLSSLLMAMASGNSRLGRAADLHLAPVLPHRDRGCAPTAASTSPKISRASASACPSTSRPRRCGRAACSSTSSAWSPRTANGGWSAPRSAATAAPPASRRRPA